MIKFALSTALALALLGSASLAHAQPPAAADTPGKTSAGVAFVQPKDWTEAAQGAATVFTSPEGDLSIAVVDVGAAADAQGAAAKAWAAYKPGVAVRPVRLSAKGAPGDGWDERVSFDYETSPSEKAEVSISSLVFSIKA